MLYLASKSARRAQLLRQIGVAFEIIPVDIDETRLTGESESEYVMRLAMAKAASGKDLKPELDRGDVILGADTIIAIDGDIIGKPRDAEDCKATLRLLSGRQHEVITAIALLCGNTADQKLSINRVRFRAIEESELNAYCACEEPMDKAGSYAVQGKAAIFIEHLEGSYSSVMGLPLFETAELLKRVKIPVLNTCQ